MLILPLPDAELGRRDPILCLGDKVELNLLMEVWMSRSRESEDERLRPTPHLTYDGMDKGKRPTLLEACGRWVSIL